MQQLTERLFNGLTWAIMSVFSSRKLRDYEQLIIDSWRDTLAPADRSVLDRQLGGFQFLQRQAGDAKLCFYYRADSDVPSFSDIRPHLHVATVTLRAKSAVQPDKQYIRAKIFLHRGTLFLVEFPKRIKRYEQLHRIDIHQTYVESVEPASRLDG